MRRPRSSELSLVRRQEGIALIVTLMIMMLVSVLMVGFVTAIVADQRASGLDRDQTQAYAAAHAGLEQLTSDLSGLFTADFSPNASQLSALTTTPPNLGSGFAFTAPGGGSGYRITFTPDGSGNPAPEDAVNGSPITAGPYQGFRGIITPYDITVTAQSRGGAEVRMRRTLQTVAVPVFQFGMFSETDLAFHAGEVFGFGGRVHTNGNLYLANATGNTLTIADRVTSVGEVVRTHLPNGLVTTSGYDGTVRIPTTIASNPVNNVYRNLTRTEGSLTGTIGSGQNEPTWTALSIGTYASNVRNGRTGARRLDLPLVADIDGDGQPDAQPIELIRRPAVANENIATPNVYTQRFFAQASVRILLSDDAADITNLPTVTATAPVSLGTGSVYAPGAGAGLLAPLAASGGPLATGNLPANVYRSTAGQSLIGGVIKIEIQRAGTTPTNGVWQDVTGEILGLGITGRNLADNNQALASRWNKVPDGAADTCAEPNPNAVIRLQRVRDIPILLANQPCGIVGAVMSIDNRDYWPNALYDTREGQTRDNLAANTMALGGIMHYVELDVNNLRRWLAGQIGVNGTNARNDNGFIVYFSDRRTNNNNALAETGEYGYEDVVNLTNATGAPNAPVLDAGEDLNGSGTLDVYGRTPRNVPAGATAPLDGTALPTTQLDVAVLANSALIARANRPLFFRRALKIVNGGLGNLPQGLTIAAENPVYVQGNFNATAASAAAAGNVPAAIIADGATLLSNNWNDLRSFTSPTDSLNRPASSTGYRMALVSGKGLAFPQPAGTSASFGSDGGAHNFVRSLEQWDNGSWHRYRGSMVSFFIHRQAVGTFKCCNQDAYNRGNRDWSFDTDFLLPARLPPGTPMFRDVNTLTFRQLLRPNQ